MKKRKIADVVAGLVLVVSILSVIYWYMGPRYVVPMIVDYKQQAAENVTADQIKANQARIRGGSSESAYADVYADEQKKSRTDKDDVKGTGGTNGAKGADVLTASAGRYSEKDGYTVQDGVIYDSEGRAVINPDAPDYTSQRYRVDQNGVYQSDDPNISYDPMNVRSLRGVPVADKLNVDYMVGRIYAPSVGMNLPIMEGITNANLNVASGTMKPGQEMGKRNYAIAGHHMYSDYELFTPITRLQAGDLVYLSDMTKAYTYRITKSFVANQNTDGYVIEDTEGDKIVTLVTCTDVYGTRRLIVRGELVNVRDISTMNQNMQSQLR